MRTSSFRLTIVIFQWVYVISMFNIGCTQLEDSNESISSAPSKGLQKISDTSISNNLSNLSYAHLMQLPGEFVGTPLAVSNNPEDVEGYGVLFSTHPLLDTNPRSQHPQAPSPSPIINEKMEQWFDASKGCKEGWVKDLHLYVAHILSKDHLAGKRQLSIVATAEEDTQLTWQGI